MIIIKAIVAFMVAALLFYILCAVVAVSTMWDVAYFDPAKWSEAGRLFVTLCIVCYGVLVAGYVIMEEKSHE